MNAIAKQERRRRAAERFRLAQRALGLSVATLSSGPFAVLTKWRRGLEISPRMVEYYLSGSHLPTGERLEVIEKFNDEAGRILLRRRIEVKGLTDTVGA